jgi:hypothetical protein
MRTLHKKFGSKAGILFLALALTLVLTLTVTPTAYAGKYIEGSPDAVLEAGRTIDDDLFIGGEDVLVAGNVNGDLFAFGENVVISGKVEGNVFTAGNTVTVSGEIDGALMIAGFELTLEETANITRNVYFGGFSFETLGESMVNRSIYGGGYQMILGGSVGRDVSAGLGALRMSGPVGGDVNIEMGEPTTQTDTDWYWYPGMPSVAVLDPGYEVEEELIDGELNIKLIPVDTDMDPDIRIDPGYFILQRVRRRIGEFISLMLVGMLALWLARKPLLKAVDEVKSNAAMDSVWGLVVYLLYIPVVFILFLLLTLLVILVSIFTLGNLAGEIVAVTSLSFFGLLTLFGILATIGTKIVLGYLVGRWILEKTSKLSFKLYWQHVAALAIGVLLYEVLRFIPFFGWLVMLAVVLIGTGAFFVLIKNALTRKPSTGVVEVDSTPVEVESTPAEVEAPPEIPESS